MCNIFRSYFGRLTLDHDLSAEPETETRIMCNSSPNEFAILYATSPLDVGDIHYVTQQNIYGNDGKTRPP